MACYRPNITIAHDLRQVSITFLRFFFFFGFFKIEIFSMFGEPLTQIFKKLVNHLLRNVSVEACIALLFEVGVSTRVQRFSHLMGIPH
jgi:hypothetical protein